MSVLNAGGHVGPPLRIMPKPAKTLKFEQAVEKLEKLVQKLEDGNMPLDESLTAFAEGMELTQFCEDKLNEAEGKVEMILKQVKGKKIADV